jgi:O-antigen/teichoic acid export membrane protein
MARESSMGVIVKNAGLDTVATIFNTIFAFGSSVVVTRTIGAELFGKYALSNSVFQVLGVFAIFGLNAGVVRLTSKYNAKGDPQRVKGSLASGMAVSAGISVVLVTLVIALAPLLSTKVFTKMQGLDLVLRIHIIALPFYALMLVMNGYTQGFKTLKYTVIVELIMRPAVRLAIIVVLFLLGLRLFGVVIGTVLSFIAAAALSFHFARSRSPFDYRSTSTTFVTREMIFYSLPLIFARVMNIIIARSNIILVGYYIDPVATGLFGAALTISPFISFGLFSFGKIFAPVISDLWERGDRQELENTFKIVTKWCFSLGFPIFIMIMLFAPSLLLVLGPEFAGAAVSLQLLAVGQIVSALVGPAGHFLAMTGRPKLNLANSIALAGVNVVLNIIFIPRWGINGAGLAMAISLVAINVARAVEIKLLYGFTPFRQDLFKPALAGAITGGLFYLVNLRLGWHDLLHTLLLCVAFLIVYIMLMSLFGLREEKEIILEVLRRRKQ